MEIMARPDLELREATRIKGGAPGWAHWRDGAVRGRRDEFSFFEGDEEVARARIYPDYQLHAPYKELPPGLYVDVDLVVVRDDRRGNEVGLEVVALLVSHYEGQEMIAFSAADRFWAKAGWVRASRCDGDDSTWSLFFRPISSKRF